MTIRLPKLHSKATQGARTPEIPTAFMGGGTGRWKIERMEAVRGPPLPPADRLKIVVGLKGKSADATWLLRGVAGHERYTTESERARLESVQPPLDRPGATRAAIIPIRKSGKWWDLPQEARRAIFEEESHHIAIGLEYLPAVARRLYHSRELGEPFDFVTWFEYAPSDAAAFDRLVERLRETKEWAYVEREIDIRLAR